MSATQNAIDDAIRAHAEAEGWNGLITGWVVIAATAQHDGPDESSGIRTVPNVGLSWPMVLGLLEAGRSLLHRKFTD